MNRFSLWLRAQPRALRLLLLANGVAYLVWQVLLIHFNATRTFVWTHLALDPGLPGILYEPWQLVTYAFLHLEPGLGGLVHVGFNMLWLVWIGRDLEVLQGPGRLLGLYVLGAIGGAVLTVGLHAALPDVPLFAGTVHGASGAVLAVMAGVALLYPHKQIHLFLLGAVRLIHLVIGFLVLDVLFLAQGGTSVSAHLGGVLTGLAFARLQQRGHDIAGWAGVFFQARRPRSGDAGFIERLETWLSGRRSKRRGGRSSSEEAIPGSHRGRPAEDDSPDLDVDRILDKISESGYESLTEEEKRALLAASRR